MLEIASVQDRYRLLLIILFITELNTGIPAITLDNTWQMCYVITGWGVFVHILLVSTAQKLTVTKADIYNPSAG